MSVSDATVRDTDQPIVVASVSEGDRMRAHSRWQLLPPALTLLASFVLMGLGAWFWSYRYVPVGIADSTGYTANTAISAVTFVPAALAAILCATALVRRILDLRGTSRSAAVSKVRSGNG